MGSAGGQVNRKVGKKRVGGTRNTLVRSYPYNERVERENPARRVRKENRFCALCTQRKETASRRHKRTACDSGTTELPQRNLATILRWHQQYLSPLRRQKCEMSASDSSFFAVSQRTSEAKKLSMSANGCPYSYMTRTF